jgi:hypothetical protein
MVVLVDERVGQGLQLGDGAGLDGLSAEPLLQGLLEPFDLAAGRGVVGSGVLLHDAQAAELDLQGGAATTAAGEPDGVDHPVVGQGGGGEAVRRGGRGEGGDHDRGGDPLVSGDAEGVAGMVVEPGDDLGVVAGAAVGSGQAVVGEVGLPALVRHRGLEPDVGRLRSLGRLGSDQAVADQDPVDRGAGHGHLVTVPQMPADRVGAGVESSLHECVA